MERATGLEPGTGAATRCRLGVSRRTKAGPQPCAAASLPDKDSNLDRVAQNHMSCLIRRSGIEVRAERFERSGNRV